MWFLNDTNSDDQTALSNGSAVERPLVSVVMPCFNVATTLESAVTSVLNQTYSNFELLLIDDGSTDGRTPQMCDEFAEHARVRVIHQDNAGLAGARNTGLNAAKGEFIALLDSDDLYEPAKLETHVDHLLSNPRVGLSFSYSRFISEDGKRLPLTQGGRVKGITPQTILCRNPVGNGSAAVLRRAALDDVALPHALNAAGGLTAFFDSELRQSEDVEFWFRLACTTAWQVEGVAEPLTLYRLSSGGLSANTHEQLATWEVFLAKATTYAPALIGRYGKRARAYQLRYLCRRALQMRRPKEAVVYLISAFREDAAIVWQEPLRTLATTAACAFAWLASPVMARST